MPEGPEIKRDADRIGKVLNGAVARAVEFRLRGLAGEGPPLIGKRIEAVSARGKALLVHFESGSTIYTHNQLYGRWYVKPSGTFPNTNRQLRLVLDTGKKAALLYSASEIEVWDTDSLDEQPYLAKLGPDPLNETVEVDALAEYLAEGDHAGRQLAGSLLDQSFVAGVGNYLRSDILFDAAVHPRAKPRDLAEDRRRRLAEAIITIMHRAYRTGGFTNDPERVASLREKGLPRGAIRHLAYGRDGRECYRCEDTIRREEMGSRGLYFCASCQTAGSG